MVKNHFFLSTVKAHGRAITLNRSGRNRQKRDAKHACMEKETPRRKKKTDKFGGFWVKEGRKDHGFGLGMT